MRNAYMRFLATYVYLVDDRHLDHMYAYMSRRDHRMMNTRCHMDTRSRTCV